MLKRFVFFLLSVFIIIVSFSFISARCTFIVQTDQENNAPIVKILSPKNNSTYQLNTPVQYKIKVSDQEDGESAFQEITADEVFLQVKYFSDPSKATAALNQPENSESAGFTTIKSSNCLNCHAFTGKLIGPSFYDINKRYPDTKSNLDLLVKHVREGSSGIWGNVAMPTHTELTKEETGEIVQWIFKNGAEPDVNYYRGTEGYFTIKPSAGNNPNGVFVITASYTDHGLKDKPKQNRRGQDAIILQGK